VLGVIYLPLSAKVEALEGLSDKLGVKPGSEVRFELNPLVFLSNEVTKP